MTATIAPHTDWSLRALGRTIALLMLATVVLGGVAQALITNRLVILHDPERTAANILAHESLYRIGFLLFMIEMSAQVAQIVLVFHLLRPVNRRIASLAVAFGLVGVTVKIVSRLFYLMPLILLKQSPAALGPFIADHLPAISHILLHIDDRGAGLALGFMGVETVLEGWLIFRSTFLPRWLGALTMIAGAGWLTFLAPTLGYELFDILALPGLIGVIAMVGWLLVKGVDEARWRAVAAAAAPLP
jgi:hypothetical protein